MYYIACSPLVLESGSLSWSGIFYPKSITPSSGNWIKYVKFNQVISIDCGRWRPCADRALQGSFKCAYILITDFMYTEQFC